MPPSISFFITGLTSSCSSTRSPITMPSLLPIRWNARYEPSASVGLICTPSSVTLRSLRPRPTRYTPPGISVPALPSAFPTGSQESWAAAGKDRAAINSIAIRAVVGFIETSKGVDDTEVYLEVLASIHRHDDRFSQLNSPLRKSGGRQ